MKTESKEHKYMQKTERTHRVRENVQGNCREKNKGSIKRRETETEHVREKKIRDREHGRQKKRKKTYKTNGDKKRRTRMERERENVKPNGQM